MKKKLVIVFFAITAIGLITCKGLEKLFALTEEKITSVQTSSPLEKFYTAMGNYSVQSVKYPANDNNLKEFTVYYPETVQAGQKFPLVVMVNGSGVATSKYEAVLKHLASWGFVVIGSEEESSWSGKGASQSLDFALKLNSDKNSPVYQKIDADKIGVAGHSQGGVGVINAVNNHANGKLYRSVYGVSTTKHPLAEFLKWPYDVSKITIPYFAVAGAGASDAGDGKDRNTGIAPLWSMQENYDNLPQNTPAVIAQRKDQEHGAMLYVPNGYMVAWFLYTLNNDTKAKGVFAGNNPEIKSNGNWQEVKIKNLK
ncbi:MAG: hypothetical protein Q4G08_06540 [Capnocytophaga sp.]|nr:hypothetical protein [Capnocytophaga sp.]